MSFSILDRLKKSELSDEEKIAISLAIHLELDRPNKLGFTWKKPLIEDHTWSNVMASHVMESRVTMPLRRQ